MWVVSQFYNRFEPRITQFLTDYRGLFCTIFLLPLSAAINLYRYFVVVVLEKLCCTPEVHKKRVEAIALAVRQQGKSGKKMVTDRPGFYAMSLKENNHKKSHTVQVPMRSTMVSIVEFDEKKMTVKCEPLVNMGQISRFLIPKGYTLAVLPELDDLTVGGLLMGFGIESTSHIHGLFQEICVEYEVVLGDGRVVIARADNEFSDLFYALPWSYGTLGMVVSATLKVIPCKPFVRLSYRRYDTMEGLHKALTEVSLKRDPENALFIEALAYSINSGVLMVGSFTDSATPKPTDPKGTRFENIALWFKKYFYVHVEEVAKPLKGDGSDEAVEIIPLRAYYHRHTRSIFWEMPHIIPFADQLWFRLLLGWAMPPNINLIKASQTNAIRKMWMEQFAVQDMLVPMTDMRDCLDLMDEEFGIYPVWLCPHLVVNHAQRGLVNTSKKCPAGAPFEMYVDIGIYGPPTRRPYDHTKSLRKTEAFVRSRDGYQGLYAMCYMDRTEFRQMFNHDLYDKCRIKYGAVDKFPEVFDKTCVRPSY